MSLSKFADIISLSNKEISEEIIKTENEIFNLRFKNSTNGCNKIDRTIAMRQ